MTLALRLTCAVLILLAVASADMASADTFGLGLQQFDIEFVMIGDPGNAPDATGNPNLAGAVSTAYRIGKFEISEEMVGKANAAGGLGITNSNRGPNKPATNLNWFEAAQFVNWLNTDVGSTPAYKFDSSGNFQLWQPGDAGYNPSNLYRNSMAKYFLPSNDEWYKAAYFDSTNGVYYDYPTGSNSVPDGIDFAGDTTFDAVFFDGGSNPQPNDISNVGVLSPFGTGGQGGNVYEWQETDYSLMYGPLNARGVRGGTWLNESTLLLATLRDGYDPTIDHNSIGFRVASVNVPEPSMMLLACSTFGLGLLARCRR